MKVVILAGGFGTRISEESHLKPKPMVEIGEKPILWHIMKGYSHYGFNEFIICAGYKQQVIKEYFADYYLHQSDITFDFSHGNSSVIHHNQAEPWKVTIVDTGLNTLTAGRIRRIREYVEGEPFLLTYGDGVSDININELVAWHQAHGRIGTLTAVHPEGRFGILDLHDKEVTAFREKSISDQDRINAGFMVMQPEIFNYIPDNDATYFEQEPLAHLASDGQLMAYFHDGFWQCMDTAREKQKLEALWATGKAPWKVW